MAGFLVAPVRFNNRLRSACASGGRQKKGGPDIAFAHRPNSRRRSSWETLSPQPSAARALASDQERSLDELSDHVHERVINGHL